ncbi:MAG TPA: pilus assembly protein [Candidatus Merdenecus merdavium]|nr:pilus assembly protein [Candidatus Merdenecus merdavium]
MVKKNTEDGSLTLEMTLLIPFILGVIFLVMFLLFYHHNKSVLLSYAYEVALSESKESKSKKQEEVFEKSAAPLIMGDLIHINVEKQQNRVLVTYKGRMNLPKGGMFFFIPHGWYELSGEVTVEQNKETEFIQRYKRIKDLVEEE